MFRQIFNLGAHFISPSIVNNSRILQIVSKANVTIPVSTRNLCGIASQKCEKLFLNTILQANSQVRTVTKYSWAKGKRKSVRTVLKRFYRLHWGGWIRTICGRNKKLWKKSSSRKRRIKQHVFCNATQSTLLDKMVGEYWKKPKYYVDNPYECYHTREEFTYSGNKPRQYIPPEER